jgi:pimeloyl-ACP methyl ester carboxylesterase
MRVAIDDEFSMGYEETGSGRPLVLLHAFPFARQIWRSQLASVCTEARVIAPDLRGFGESAPFAGIPSIDQMADDVVALLDRLGIPEPVILGGLSMGGYVALAFARRHPRRLRALILADTRAEPDDQTGKANRDKMIALTNDRGSRAVIEQMLPKMLSEQTQRERPRVKEDVIQMATSQSKDAIAAALLAMRDRADARPSLSSIRVPTLVLVGAEDALTPPEMSERLAAAIPGAELKQIPSAGHLSNLDQPDLFNEEVRQFLRSVC